MPNSLTAAGLTLATQTELITLLSAAYRQIYGDDIDLSPSSPDAQMMMIFIQVILDNEDLLMTIYSGMDPDNAVGTILDQRCALNGVQRLGGTFSVTNITLVITQSIELIGLDQSSTAPYTVADAQGNQWQLLTTVAPSSAGTYVYAFQAANPGAISPVANTITLPVTVILGVQSINNPTNATSIGTNQETDAALKIRRQKSVALSSQGYLQGLLGALNNLTGLTFAAVYENVTGTTDGDGIPGHSIWVIVAGAASNASVANAIYTKRNAGCGMTGSISFPILQADGSTFDILWDDVTEVPLFIKFSASSLNGTNPPDIASILDPTTGLPSIFVPGVFEQVNINDLATLVQEIDPNTLVTSSGFSLSSGGSYTSTLTPTTKDKQFQVTSTNIIILPIIVNPTAPTVVHGTTEQFSSLGGFGTITWTIHTNNSGGTINSSSGLYTAGSTHPVTDVVRATDALSNTTDVSVSVT